MSSGASVLTFISWLHSDGVMVSAVAGLLEPLPPAKVLWLVLEKKADNIPMAFALRGKKNEAQI